MTEITRETLELAALAGGHVITSFEPAGPRGALVAILGVNASGYDIHWRPHTGIADAARLAVKLRIDVAFGYHIAHKVYASRSASSPPCPVSVAHDGTQPDKERAYCHAVTLCAAEIGRRMKEAK